MARIMIVSETDLPEPLRAQVEKTKEMYGVFLGVRRLMLVRPELADPVRQIYTFLNLRPDSPLTRLQREMLGTVVNGQVGGRSCLGLHTEALRRLTGDEHLSPAFAHEWPSYDLDPKTRALLAYAQKLTLMPYQIEDSDIDALRAAGWDEPAIYEATALVGFWNFSGRLEAAAGLPLDQPTGASFPEATPDA